MHRVKESFLERFWDDSSVKDGVNYWSQEVSDKAWGHFEMLRHKVVDVLGFVLLKRVYDFNHLLLCDVEWH